MNRHNRKYEYYDIPEINTLVELIEFGRTNGEDKTVFHTGKDEEKTISFIEFSDMVRYLGTFLLSRKYRNSHIGILSENSVEWCTAYFGICNSGNVAVPLDKNENKEVIRKLIEFSDCKAVFYSDKCRKLIDEIEGVEYFELEKIDEYLSAGKKLIEEGNNEFLDIVIDKDDLASIVFTSGTTGDKKGVMLSHGNLMSDTVYTCRNVCARNTQILLPLHHTFAWASGLFAIFLYCVDAHISGDLKRVVKDLKNNKPQNISAVPLMVDMLYRNILNNIKKRNKERQFRIMLSISNFLMRIGIDLRRRIFREIHDAFGGNLEIIICGGAAMDESTEKALYDMGFTVISGYGITECSPVVAVNRNNDFRFGSVGRILGCNEVRIDEPDEKGIGEVLVKGLNVMKGYYKDEKATEEVLVDGWFKTGDHGYILDDYLFITGRKKDLIVLANGENVAAEEIEMKLQKIDYVKEVLVYEEGQKIVAEFYLDDNISKETLQKDVDAYNRSVPIYKNISYIKIRDIPFEKTTTMKIKRG